jgi:hypothetical protein
MKFLKVSFVFFFLIFLSGCLQSTALLIPGMTVASTGNVLQAGIQYGANTAIKYETGKNTFEHLHDAVESQSKIQKFKKKFEITRKKLKLN